MTQKEVNISVNLDVTNPGQFFACCGLLELAHRFWLGAEGWFEKGHFRLRAEVGEKGSLADMLTSLVRSEVRAGGNSTVSPKTEPFEVGPPISMRLDWWLRDDGTPNLLKTWAANATARQMFSKWRDPFEKNIENFIDAPENMLGVSERIQGSYGFDSDVGWDALNVGFSLNEHAGLKELPTHPAVELLGAIGLQRCFPILNEREQVVQYATWHIPLGAPVVRIAAIGGLPAVTIHRLYARFVYRGSFKGLDTATIV